MLLIKCARRGQKGNQDDLDFLDGAAESLMMLYQNWRGRESNRFSGNKGVKSIILLRFDMWEKNLKCSVINATEIKAYAK